MNIKILSLTNVTVDGVPSGSVVDVLANTRDDAVRAPLLDALLKREAGILAECAAELETAKAAAAAETAAAAERVRLEIQTNLDQLVQAAEAAFASGDAEAVAAVITQARAYTSEARAAANAQRRAELEAELAAL